MTLPAELEGRRFGLLRVLRDVGSNDRGSRLWECECECGKRVSRNTMDLRGGRAYSCGCRRRAYGSRKATIAASGPRMLTDERKGVLATPLAEMGVKASVRARDADCGASE